MMKNYALIIESINTALIESFEKEDKQKIKDLITEIKSDKALKYLYTIVDNLKNGVVNQSNVDEFINENIKAIKTIKEGSFKMFDNILNESTVKSTNDLSQHIGVILFEEKNIFNISEYNKSFEAVKEHLINENTWRNKLSNELTGLSSEFETLDEDDKHIFETYLKSSNKEKKQVFSEMKNECVELINQHLNSTESSDTKVKLYEARDMITKLNDDTENFEANIVKLHDLKKGLI